MYRTSFHSGGHHPSWSQRVENVAVVMGQADIVILAVSVAGLALIAYVIWTLTRSKEGRHRHPRRQEVQEEEIEEEGEEEEEERDDVQGQEAVPQGGLRRRARAGEVEANADPEPVDFTGMTKKEIAKIEKKRAKAQQREAMEAMREERREMEENRMQLLREREAEKEEEFRAKEEERKREKAKEEMKRIKAYNHLKDPFPDYIINMLSIEAAQKLGTSSTGRVGSFDAFISYVKDKKVIALILCDNDDVITVYFSGHIPGGTV